MSLQTTFDASWTCQHERRPHTTVCLLCRRDEREAASARRRRAIGRAGLMGLAAVFFSAGSVAAIAAMEGRWPAAPALGPKWETAGGWFELARTRTRDVISNLTRRASAAPIPIYASPIISDSVALTDTINALATTDPVLIALQAAIRQAQDSAAKASPAPFVPIVAEGRTELREGIVAVRTGDTIAVHFDTPQTRTRQPLKFEQLVRSTLPAVYGAAVETLLARVGVGDLIRGVDPTAGTPTHGVYLPLASGWSLALWPETRPGRDGPLIVTYRTALTR